MLKNMDSNNMGKLKYFLHKTNERNHGMNSVMNINKPMNRSKLKFNSKVSDFFSTDVGL
jgi:hypothetical protein